MRWDYYFKLQRIPTKGSYPRGYMVPGSLKLLIFLFLFIVQLDASSQNKNRTDQPQEIPPFSAHRITFQSFPENFDYNGVRSILRDHIGYMWYATEDGLIRFDGLHLKLYEHIEGDNSSLSNTEVNALLEDSKGNLWIGTSKGLNLYNRNLDNFIDFGKENPGLERLSENYINSLFLDDKSQLWIGTFGDGFHVYKHESSTLQHFSLTQDNPSDSITTRVTRFAIYNSEIWMGSDNGLYHFKLKDTSLVNYSKVNFNSSHARNNYIVSLYADSQGELWIGTRGDGINHLIQYDGDYSIEKYTEGALPNSLMHLLL